MTKIWTKFVPLGLCHKTKGMTLIMDLKSQWTRVNLNSNRTDPCAGLCYVRQVPARPYPMQARFQL